jgi:hypothetical protein
MAIDSGTILSYPLRKLNNWVGCSTVTESLNGMQAGEIPAQSRLL